MGWRSNYKPSKDAECVIQNGKSLGGQMFKSYFIFLFIFVGFSVNAKAELPLVAKQIIFDEISADVFFEDEGAIRAPQAIENFKFDQVDEFEFSVTGESYSDWDGKNLIYHCNVTIISRGTIISSNDISLNCTLENENWPHM